MTTSNSSSPTMASSMAAASSPSLTWHSLGFSAGELRPDVTLTNGQCFHWIPHSTVASSDAAMIPDPLQSSESIPSSSPSGSSSSFSSSPLPFAVPSPTWTGTIDDLVITIRQVSHDTLFAIRHPVNADVSLVKERLRDYFHAYSAPLLHDLYAEWSERDPRFARIAPAYQGLRLIRQRPLECVLSFICSSNNHIPRITQMLRSLRMKYGSHLITLDPLDSCDEMISIPQVKLEHAVVKIENEESSSSSSPSAAPTRLKSRAKASSSTARARAPIAFYSFPTLQQLARATDEELRSPPLNFGYRAKYIVETVRILQEKGGEAWLDALRGKSRDEAEEALQLLSGVGPKVASCAALFCLDSFSSIPVDTHVFTIAVRDYASSFRGMKNKAGNKKVHESVATFFRDLFGEQHAGWAHSVLFCADLTAFKQRLIDYEANMIKPELDQPQKVSIKRERAHNRFSNELANDEDASPQTSKIRMEAQSREARLHKRFKVKEAIAEQHFVETVARDLGVTIESSSSSFVKGE